MGKTEMCNAAPPNIVDLTHSGALCPACLAGLFEHTDATAPSSAAPTKCHSCLGLLSEIDAVASDVATLCADRGLAEFDVPSFSLEIELPRTVAKRHALLVDKYGANAHFAVRREFAKLLAEHLERATGLSFSKEAPLNLLIKITHPSDVPPPKSQRQGNFRNKRPRVDIPAHQPTAEEVFSPSLPCTDPVKVFSVTFRRAPIYIGGRYLKLSREISQTPWMIGKSLKTPLSVSSCIDQTVCAALNADECGFVSAGREDANVRMLGTGRPFYLEVKNARISDPTKIDIEQVADTINAKYCDQVQVSQLCFVTADQAKHVKDGEEFKAKTYSALVWAKDVDQSKLDELNTMKEFTISQNTPTRVLHRRANLVRPKIIHSIHATRLDAHFLHVHLETQAGTYIKEFVTGDLGRTSPSLGDLLGTTADILELDVTSVALEWPPAASSA